jgi:serine/threonine-protein kinase HipA
MLVALANNVLLTSDERDFLSELFAQHTLSVIEHAYIDALLDNIKTRTVYLKIQAEYIQTMNL